MVIDKLYCVWLSVFSFLLHFFPSASWWRLYSYWSWFCHRIRTHQQDDRHSLCLIWSSSFVSINIRKALMPSWSPFCSFVLIITPNAVGKQSHIIGFGQRSAPIDCIFQQNVRWMYGIRWFKSGSNMLIEVLPSKPSPQLADNMIFFTNSILLEHPVIEWIRMVKIHQGVFQMFVIDHVWPFVTQADRKQSVDASANEGDRKKKNEQTF